MQNLETRALEEENEALRRRLAGYEDKAVTGNSNDVHSLLKENKQLRQQLEKIGSMNMTGAGGPSTDDGQGAASELKKTVEQLRTENDEVMAQMLKQQDELLAVKEERESLLAMIQLLQEELSRSEKLGNKSSSH